MRTKTRKAVAAVKEEPQELKVIADQEEEVEDIVDESEEESDSDSQTGEEEEEEEEEEEDEEEEEEVEEEEDEEENEESKRETLKKILQPFGKDQIIDFLKEAALKNPSIVERIAQSADSDPALRRIFIYGLGWDATSEQVLSVFKKYGEIEECRVVMDKVTGRAKGYGFVLFKTRHGAQKSLKHSQKKVGTRMTSCQLASAGPVPNQLPVQESNVRKIFVANVGPQINSDNLRSFFAKFGEIEEGPIGRDPVTGKFKGYALFVYKTADGCKKALEEPVKFFESTQLQCRKALEGHRANKNQPGVDSLHQSDINSINFGMCVNPAAAIMMGQNPGIPLANPMLASALGQAVLPPPAVSGYLPSMGLASQLPFGFGGGYGVNNITPSMIGGYSSQAALQGSYRPQVAGLQVSDGFPSQAALYGMGAYQSAQLGRSSTESVTAATTTLPQSGFGLAGTTLPPYLGL